MKTFMKKSLLILLAMSLLVSIAACGGSTATTTPATASAGDAASTEATAAGETAATGASTPSDLSGEISEIIGNEVTLRLYAVDETITEETRVPGSGRGQTATTEPKEFSGETATIVIPVGTLIVKRVRSTMPSESSGETSETGTGPVEEEIGLDDLSVGTQLKIYYKEGTEIIEKVLAVPPRA